MANARYMSVFDAETALLAHEITQMCVEISMVRDQLSENDIAICIHMLRTSRAAFAKFTKQASMKDALKLAMSIAPEIPFP
jgi:hypothetical protein